MQEQDWIIRAKVLFTEPRPDHFTNYNHCDECWEHDETLRQSDVDSIGMEQLGNPGWDPICFCSVAGKKYYMPALIRLALTTLEKECYLDQLLFHLAWDDVKNALFVECNPEQRRFIAEFCSYLLEHHIDRIDQLNLGDELLSVYQIWSED